MATVRCPHSAIYRQNVNFPTRKVLIGTLMGSTKHEEQDFDVELRGSAGTIKILENRFSKAFYQFVHFSKNGFQLVASPFFLKKTN